MKKLLITLLVILASAATFGGISYWNRLVHQPLPIKSPIRIELPQGAGIGALSLGLANENLVMHPYLVRLAARLSGYDRRLKAGEYQLEQGMSLSDVFEQMASGRVVLHHLTLPEGLTTAQMIRLINQNEWLTGHVSIQIAEGELLPETYTFHKGLSRNKIIRQAQTDMQNKIRDIWKNRDKTLPLQSPEELVVLASIIEKETAQEDERALVASVFVNRLKRGMMLQTDPTVIYALTLGQTELGRPLTRKDLQTDSPYNTYKKIGLPPTPIANPGVRSLEAAAHPAQTPYLYFVANGKGGHNFAATLQEHNRNVQNWKNTL